MNVRPLRSVLAVAALAATALPAHAQDAGDWEERCRRETDRRAVHCEVRESRIPAPSQLNIDARPNGGVSVRAHDGADVVVRARLRATAGSDGDARALARDVRVLTDGGSIRAEGPANRDRVQWSVSYEVLVPRRQDLDVRSMNGGISVENVTGRMELRSMNGGLTLRSLAGDVQARTTNGGIRVEMAGRRWEGGAFRAETTNGGVVLELPQGYAANLEAGTVNGGMTVDFPVTVQGRIGRRLETALNGGGPPVRVSTTNGGVRIRQR